MTRLKFNIFVMKISELKCFHEHKKVQCDQEESEPVLSLKINFMK